MWCAECLCKPEPSTQPDPPSQPLRPRHRETGSPGHSAGNDHRPIRTEPSAVYTLLRHGTKSHTSCNVACARVCSFNYHHTFAFTYFELLLLLLLYSRSRSVDTRSHRQRAQPPKTNIRAHAVAFVLNLHDPSTRRARARALSELWSTSNVTLSVVVASVASVASE